MGVEDNVSKQLKPLFEDPPEWRLPQQQKDEVYKARLKVKGLKEAKPLPEGYSTHIGAPQHHVYDNEGNLRGGTQSVFLAHNGEQVGEVRWNTLTGHVNWLGIHPDHRIIGLHHLLNAAHEWAAKEGGIGPFTSDSLSEHSASLMKRFVPSAISSGTYLPPRRARASYYSGDVHESTPNETPERTESDRVRGAIRAAITNLELTQMHVLNRHVQMTDNGPVRAAIPPEHPDYHTLSHLTGAKIGLQNVHGHLRQNPSEVDDARIDMNNIADTIEEHHSYDSLDVGGPLRLAVSYLRGQL